MAVYVSLLRAVNVTGTALPMAELKAICEELGFTDVQTYIQSGNVLFRSGDSETTAADRLDAALGARFGKKPGAASAGALTHMVAPGGEEAKIAGAEIYVHYPGGSGRSKLKLPALKPGASRNLNTVRKLADMAQAMEDRV